MNFLTHHCWIFVLLLIIQHCSAFVYLKHRENEWSYHGQTGPAHWCEKFPTCCGTRQSPVNINVSSAYVLESSEFEIKFTNYDVEFKNYTLENSGHSVILTIDDNATKPSITGGMLKKRYNFHSLHFHWGSSYLLGSEHTLSGKRFPLEVHLVHTSTKFKGLEEAIASNETDAVAVIGIFFKLQFANNTAISPIIEKLPSIIYKGKKTKLTSPVKLSNILSPDTDQYIRYHGSLTTPGCNEVVVWSIYGVPNNISQSQLSTFRNLLSSSKGEEPPTEMSDNFRPVQPLNKRSMYIFSTVNWLEVDAD